jgi:hypothetical protein
VVVVLVLAAVVFVSSVVGGAGGFCGVLFKYCVVLRDCATTITKTLCFVFARCFEHKFFFQSGKLPCCSKGCNLCKAFALSKTESVEVISHYFIALTSKPPQKGAKV